jgi:hypothetical protein
MELTRINRENHLSVEAWVKAIKSNHPVAWLLAEGIAVTNLSMDEEPPIGFGAFPGDTVDAPWRLIPQDRVSHALCIVRICYELLLPDKDIQTDENYQVFAEAYVMIYDPKNNLPLNLN